MAQASCGSARPAFTLAQTNNCGTTVLTLTVADTSLQGFATIKWGDGAVSNPVNPLSTTNRVFTRSTTLAGARTVRLIRTIGGCKDSVDRAITVTVRTIPSAPVFTVIQPAVCGSNLVSFKVSSPVPGGIYLWTFGYLANTGIGDSVSYAYPQLAGTASNNYTVGCRVVVNGCTSTVANRIITLSQLPDASGRDANSLTQEFNNCANASAGGTYTIDFESTTTTPELVTRAIMNWGDGSPFEDITTTYVAASPANIVQHTYTSQGVFTMNLAVTGTNGCVVERQFKVLNIGNPIVALANPANSPGCAPRTFTFPVNNWQSNDTSTKYVMNWGDGTPIEIFNHPPPATVTHTYDSVSCGSNVTGTLNCTDCFGAIMTAVNACASTVSGHSIKIFRSPKARYTVADTNVCVNKPVSFANMSIDGYNNNCLRTTRYIWNFGTGRPDTLSAFGKVNRSFTFRAPGLYWVVLKAVNTCGDTSYFRRGFCVTPEPEVKFDISYPNGLCTSNKVIFTNRSNLANLTCGKFDYDWQVSNADGYASCNTDPVAPAFRFVDSTTRASESPVIQFLKPGVYALRLRIISPCGTSVKDSTITIKARPFIRSLGLASSICVGGTVDVTPDVGNCLADSAIRYNWSAIGSSQPLATGASLSQLTYSTPGRYEVRLITRNECGSDTLSDSITVHPYPVIIAQSDSLTLCEGSSGWLRIERGPINTTQQPDWQFFNGTTASWTSFTNSATIDGQGSDTLRIFNVPLAFSQGTIRVVLRGEGGCNDTSATMKVRVIEKPVFTLSPQSISVCEGDPATFSALVSNTGVTYQWQISRDLGVTWQDSAGANQPSLVIPSAGIQYNGWQFRVQARSLVFGGCETISSAAIITIRAKAKVSKLDSFNVCVGSTIQLASQTIFPSGATGSSQRWQYSTNNGTNWLLVPASAPYSGVTTSTLSVGPLTTTLNNYLFRNRVITNGCTTLTNSSQVIVKPLPIITSNVTNKVSCELADSVFFGFTAGSQVTNVSWQLSTDGGTTWANLSDGYPYSGTTTDRMVIQRPTMTMNNHLFRAILINDESCSLTTAAGRLTINERPVITVIGTKRQVCLNDTAIFNATSTNTLVGYQWQTNASGVWQNVTGGHQATLFVVANTSQLNGKHYRLIGTDSNGCNNVSDSLSLDILPSPVAEIFSTDTIVCYGDSLLLTGIGAGGYHWLPAPGLSSTSGISVFVKPLQTTVYTLVVTNGLGCKSIATKRISVLPQPIAVITNTNTNYCVGQSLTVRAQSTLGSSYKWYKNGVEISGQIEDSLQLGQLTLSDSATYVVEVTTTSGSYTCVARSQPFNLSVNPLPLSYAISGPALVCQNNADGRILVAGSQVGISYLLIKDGVPSGISIAGTGAPISLGPITTTGNYRVLAQSAAGCQTIFNDTLLITAKPLASAQSLTNDTAVCRGQQIHLKAADSPGTISNWWFGGALVSTSATFITTPSISGRYSLITIDTTNGVHCSDTATVYVTVLERPLISTPVQDTTVCAGQHASFNVGLAPGSMTYQWQRKIAGTWQDILNATSPLLQLHSLALVDSGSFFRVVITNAAGCTTISDSALLRVNALPLAAVDTTVKHICLGDTIMLSAKGSYASYTWSGVAGLLTTSGQSVLANPLTTTRYTVFVYNAAGCLDSASTLVIVNPRISGAIYAPDYVVCNGEPIVIRSLLGRPGKYQWYKDNVALSGQNADSLVIQSSIIQDSGYYHLTIIDTAFSTNCQSKTNSIRINVVKRPDATISATATTLCPGDSSLLSVAPIAGLATWAGVGLVQNTGFQVWVKPQDTTTYTVAVIDTAGCQSSSSIAINVKPTVQLTIGPDTSVCQSADPFQLVAVPGGGSWSGAGVSAAGLFTPAGLVGPQTVTYSYLDPAVNCQVRLSQVITVKQLPVITTPTLATICSGGVFAPAITTTSLATFEITAQLIAGAATGFTANGQMLSQIVDTIINTGNQDAIISYSLTPVQDGCKGATVVVQVTVKPSPGLSVSGSGQRICGSGLTNLTIGSQLPNSSYTFRAAGSPNIIGFADQNIPTLASSISQLLQNLSLTDTGFVVYTIWPISPDGCAQDSLVAKVIISPKPTISVVAPQLSICSGQTTSITATVSTASIHQPTIIKYIASASAGVSGQQSGQGGVINQTLMNTGLSQGTVTYKVFAETDGYCSSDTVSITVMVNPAPVTTAVNDTICSGETTFIPISSNIAGTQFSWYPVAVSPWVSGAAPGTGGSIIQALSNSSHTATGFVTYVIKSAFNGCFGDSVLINVIVRPATKIVTDGLTTTYCKEVVLNHPLANTAGVTATYVWRAISNTGLTGVTNGSGSTLNLVLINPTNAVQQVKLGIKALADGCAGIEDTITLSVNPEAVVNSIPPVTVCSGTRVAVPLSASVASASYNWVPVANPGVTGSATGIGDSLVAVLTNTTSQPQEQFYSVTAQSNGCQGQPVLVSVTVLPTADLILSQDTLVVCSGSSVSLQLLSNTAGTDYVWQPFNINPALSGQASGSGLAFTQTLSSSAGAGPLHQQYLVTATSQHLSVNCPGEQKLLTIKVLEQPQALISKVQVGTCANASIEVNLSNLLYDSLTSFETSVLQVNNLAGASSPGVVRQFTQQLVNTTQHQIGQVSYLVKTRNSAGCVTDLDTITVSVNPEPALSIASSTNTYCSGDTVTVLLSATVAGSTFSVAASAGLTPLFASPTSNSTLRFVAQNASDSLQQLAIIKGAATGNGCSSKTDSVQITILPKPSVVMPVNRLVVCNAGQVALPLNNTTEKRGTYTYRPIYVGGSISGPMSGSADTLRQVLANAGTTIDSVVYEVKASVDGCVGEQTRVVVILNPKPFLQGVLPPVSVCDGDTVGINLVNGVVGGSFTWSVAPSPFIIGLSSGTGNVIAGRLVSSDSVVPRQVQLKLVPTANGCSGDTINYQIIVKPSPKLQLNNATAMLCQQGQTDIRFISSVAGSSFRISSQVSGSVIGATAATTVTNGIINDQLVNLDPASRATVLYSVTPISPDGCLGATYSTTVMVNPVPELAAVQVADTICSGEVFMASFRSTLQDSIQYVHQYNYTATPSAQISGAQNGTGSTISQRLINNTATAQVQSFVLFGKMDSCQLQPKSVRVVVMPEPVVYRPALAAVCSGERLSHVLSSNVSGVFFSRSVVSQSPHVIIRQAGANESVGDTLFNASDSLTGSVTYKLNATINGCAGPDSLWTIAVKPRPKTLKSVDSVVLCGGGLASFSVRSTKRPATITYVAVASGNVSGASSGSGETINQTLVNTANNRSGYVQYIVSNVADGCTAVPETLHVKLRPVPVVRFAFATADTAFCVGQPISLENSSIRHLDDTLYTTWTWGTTNQSTAWEPAPSFSQAGRYKIKLVIRSGFGCVDSLVKYVRIIDRPVPRFTAAVPTSACSPVLVTFTNRTIKPAFEDQYSWFWDFGNGITSTLEQPGPVLFNGSAVNDTVFKVRLHVRTRCSTIVYTDSILVRPDHEIAFGFEQDTVCARTSFRIGNMSRGYASQYIWRLGDGRPDVVMYGNQPMSISYNYFGLRDTVIHVRLIAFTACGNDTLTKRLVVRPNRVVALFTPSASIGCSPLTVSFTSNQLQPARIEWDWADGNTQVGGYSASHTFVNTTSAPLTFRVRMKAYSGSCGLDSTYQDIVVWPQPEARFTLPRRRYCVGDTVLVNNLSAAGTSSSWVFGNGIVSNQTQPRGVSYAAPGMYYIRLTVTSQNALQCRSMAIDSVLIEAKPRAVIGNTSASQLTVCAGQPISFINNSTLASRYVWRFGTQGAASTAATPVFAYQSAGRYRLSLEAFNAANCSDSAFLWVDVMPKPVIQVSASVSSGCSPLSVSIVNQTMQPQATQGSFEWVMPNGSRFNGYQPPVQLLTNLSGNQTRQIIKLRVTSLTGCVDTVSLPIDVYPKPVASIHIQRDVVTQDNPVVRFFNRTSLASQATYTWSFGDGTTVQVSDTNYVDHRYDTTGRYKAVLYVTTQFGCKDSTIRWVTVTASRPRPAYLLNGQDTVRGCMPLAISVSNQSRFATSYVWDFGNGQTSRQAMPTGIVYTRPGVYKVKLTVRNGAGIDSLVRQQAVIVSGLPVASFSISDSLLTLPQAVLRFSNTSTGATRYRWDFGDGDSSDAVNPVHQYKEVGKYTTRLVAYNAAGCADTFVCRTAIDVKRDARIQMPDAFTPTRSQGLNDTFGPVMAGAVTYRMQIFNRWGEEIFETTSVSKGWDGTYKGAICLPDTYHYKVEASFSNGERVLKIGTLTLIR